MTVEERKKTGTEAEPAATGVSGCSHPFALRGKPDLTKSLSSLCKWSVSPKDGLSPSHCIGSSCLIYLFLTWVRRMLLCTSDGKTFKGRGLELEQREGTGSSAGKGSHPGRAIPVCYRGGCFMTATATEMGISAAGGLPRRRRIWRALAVGKDQSLQ